jgi:class 3 adenylate cyclase
MARLQRKSFASAEEVRHLGPATIDVVSLDETTLARITYPPGFRWSVDARPIVGTEWCEHHHLGICVAGRIHIVTADGIESEIGPGEAYEIPPGHDGWTVGDEPFQGIEFASARTFGVLGDEPGNRTLATILFTDIVDSTATLARVGDDTWRELLIAHNGLMRDRIQRFRGREIGTTGDGFLALFDGAARAVRCAASMATAVADLGIAIRAGIHTGEVEVVGGQPRGVAVHAAARVAALAGPGEVLVSATTRDLLDGSGLAFESRGEHELRGLAGARAIFALSPA